MRRNSRICGLGILGTVAVAVSVTQAHASLLGTQLTLGTIQQASSTSQPVSGTFPRTATVVDPGVEYPDVNSLTNPGVRLPPGFDSVVNVAIDAGPDYITYNFANAGSGRFTTGFQNTYVFTFSDPSTVDLTSATVDPSTTLGLSNADLSVSGDQLFVNVSGISFNSSNFARIDLGVTGGPTGTSSPSSPSSPSLPNPPELPNSPSSPGASSSPVPEPGTFSVLAAALIFGTFLLHRRAL